MYSCVKSGLHVKYQILDQKTQLDVSLCTLTSLVHEFTFKIMFLQKTVFTFAMV